MKQAGVNKLTSFFPKSRKINGIFNFTVGLVMFIKNSGNSNIVSNICCLDWQLLRDGREKGEHLEICQYCIDVY